jgi:hypothetical protein
MTLLGLLFVLCCQDPPPALLDVVELKNGDVLHGRVLVAIDGFVEIEVEPGASVGFPSAQVAAIRRGVVVAPAAQSLVPPRREWFVLHDASGAAVGWLAAAVAHRPDGGFAVTEEYEFQDGRRRYQVTSLAVADAGGAPTSAFFRERVTAPAASALSLPGLDVIGQQDHVVDERIVEAECRGEALHVTRVDRLGRRERTVPWGPRQSFPLLARTMARARRSVVAEQHLFDPAGEEMVVRSYDGRRLRSIAVDGKLAQVTEVAESGPTLRNHEWVDANARTLRRELAGPALVAVATDAANVRHPLGGGQLPAVVAEPGQAFGVWIPNPAWSPTPDLPAGNLALACAAHGAVIQIVRLDHLPAGATADVAVNAVANAFRLLHPGVRIVEQRAGRLRDRTTWQLVALGRSATGEIRAEIDVVAHDGSFLVCTCLAPVAAWDELAGDFAGVRRSVEFAAQALQPRLQGPLAGRGAAVAGGKPKVAPAGVASRPAPRPSSLQPAASSPSAPTNDVRIPGGG